MTGTDRASLAESATDAARRADAACERLSLTQRQDAELLRWAEGLDAEDRAELLRFCGWLHFRRRAMGG